MATWQISFEHIRKERPSAARLLSLISLFDRERIPEYLLSKYEDSNAEVNREVVVDMGFEEDVSTLTNYSLIDSNIESNMFRMHRLVQFSTGKWLELCGELDRWKERYIRMIDEAYPIQNYKNWTRCETLFPHAKVAVSYRPMDKMYLE